MCFSFHVLQITTEVIVSGFALECFLPICPSFHVLQSEITEKTVLYIVHCNAFFGMPCSRRHFRLYDET